MNDPNRCAWSVCERKPSPSSPSSLGYCRFHLAVAYQDEAETYGRMARKELDAIIREDDERRARRERPSPDPKCEDCGGTGVLEFGSDCDCILRDDD